MNSQTIIYIEEIEEIERRNQIAAPSSVIGSTNVIDLEDDNEDKTNIHAITHRRHIIRKDRLWRMSLSYRLKCAEANKLLNQNL